MLEIIYGHMENICPSNLLEGWGQAEGMQGRI